ncbi:MAG: branched-chain amino acid ABC transporter permease [Alphaproteobacteria bacterium]|nr:branched-chain amino acid ABC transporter permease [Alphaproteobacteria bacterium]
MSRGEAPSWFGMAVFAALALVPLLAGEYWTEQLTRYLVFGMFALSLGLVWGQGGMLCFGQAMFFGLGGYLMALATTGMLGPLFASTYAGLALALLGAGAAAAAIGYFLFWGAGLSGAYLAVVTLAMAYIVEQAVRSSYWLGADNGLSGIPPLDFGLFSGHLVIEATAPRYYLILALLGLAYWLLVRLSTSPFGLVVAAIKGNPMRAAFLGHRILAVRLRVFVVGAALAGLAGALFVATDAFASPTLIGFGLSTEVLIWVALGGREMLLAALLGALAVRLLEGWLATYLGDYWLLGLGVVFMATVVLLPAGLIAAPLRHLAGRRDA